jgi:hypothetical protein
LQSVVASVCVCVSDREQAVSLRRHSGRIPGSVIFLCVLSTTG